MNDTPKRLAFTIGYGGRSPEEFLNILSRNGVRTVADVRLMPNRAYLGVFAKAKTPEKGIEGLLAHSGIRYVSLTELGNPFKDEPNWKELYRDHLGKKGESLLTRMKDLEEPFCLLCSEKGVNECHRLQVAEMLESRGYQFTHLT